MRSLKDLLLNPVEDEPNDKPLSFREKMLILCIFYVWFSLFLSIAFIPYYIASIIILFSLFGVTLLASPLVVPVLLALAAILLVLAIFFSFKVGKKRINKKLGRDFKWEDLIGYFLIAFFATVIIYVTTSFIGYFEIPVLWVLPYLLLLFALLYILWWN